MAVIENTHINARLIPCPEPTPHLPDRQSRQAFSSTVVETDENRSKRLLLPQTRRSVDTIHRLASSDVVLALTSGGHNAGIVSEPGHPGRYHHLLTTPSSASWRTPDEWLQQAPRRDGSWWPAWSGWLIQQGNGRRVPARHPARDPALGPAPGTYVFVRYGD
jgi:hypothetical protein